MSLSRPPVTGAAGGGVGWPRMAREQMCNCGDSHLISPERPHPDPEGRRSLATRTDEMFGDVMQMWLMTPKGSALEFAYESPVSFCFGAWRTLRTWNSCRGSAVATATGRLETDIISCMRTTGGGLSGPASIC